MPKAASPPPASRNGLVIYQTQPGKWFLEASGLLAVRWCPCPPPPPAPKTGCRLPLPLPRPVSAEGEDTPGQQSQLALASASPGRQMANTPCQCREGLRCGRPGEHCGSALLRNLLWLPSFSQWEAPLQGEPKRLGGGAQLHSDLMQSLRQVTQTT